MEINRDKCKICNYSASPHPVGKTPTPLSQHTLGEGFGGEGKRKDTLF